MINHYNPIVSALIIAYITLSFSSIPFLLGYGIYRLVSYLKRRTTSSIQCGKIVYVNGSKMEGVKDDQSK